MAYRQSLGRRAWGLGASTSPAVQSALASAAASSGVPLSLLQSLATVESSNNPSAVSPKGAQGLLQLMPGTAAQYGVTNPFDPQQNANAGAAYLASLYKQYGNWNDALVAYNEGPGNFAKYGAFASSSDYASNVLSGSALPMDTGSPLGVSTDLATTDVSGLFDLSTLDQSVQTMGLNPLAIGGILLAGLALVWLVG